MNKKLLISGALIAASALGAIGGSSLNAISTFAQDATTAQVTQSPAPAQPNSGGQMDPSKGGHIGSNGTKEELLTGDTAEKVKAAAQAANPGGTIEMVETDAEGSPYEAHMTTSDGSRVTVKVESNFKVTNTESAQGPKAN